MRFCVFRNDIGYILEQILAPEDSHFVLIKLHSSCYCVKMNFAYSKTRPMCMTCPDNLRIVVWFFALFESAFVLHSAQSVG